MNINCNNKFCNNNFFYIIVIGLFIFIFDFFAKKFHWYFNMWYLDILMHFLGGFLIALTGIYLGSGSLSWDFKSNIKIILFILSIGILWEIYEITINQSITKNTFNLLDTLSDLFFDLLGGLVLICYYKVCKIHLK
jgi:hypothetical protein